MENIYTVFIDTCIFDWMKNNFSYDNNPRIVSIKNHCINKNIELVFISVTKNEILGHIKNSIEEDLKVIKKLKKEISWTKNFITDEIVNENISQKEKQFLQFLEDTKAKVLYISNINPEIVFEDYFLSKLPFESKENKKSEFPDAFTIKAIEEYRKTRKGTFIVVTSDNGMIGSIKDNPKLDDTLVFNTFDNALDFINKNSKEIDEKVKSIIIEHKKEIELEALMLLDIESNIDEIEIYGYNSFKIIKFDDISVLGYNDTIIDASIDVQASFSVKIGMFNQDDSIWDSEDEEYIDKKYDKCNFVFDNNVTIDIETKIDKNNNIEYSRVTNVSSLKIKRGDIDTL